MIFGYGWFDIVILLVLWVAFARAIEQHVEETIRQRRENGDDD